MKKEESRFTIVVSVAVSVVVWLLVAVVVIFGKVWLKGCRTGCKQVFGSKWQANPVGINSKLKTALFAFRYMRIEQEVKAVVIGVAGFDACGPLKQNRPFHCAFHVLFTC